MSGEPMAAEPGEPPSQAAYPARAYALFGDAGLGDTIRYFFTLLRRNLWLIAAIIGLLLLAGLGATMLQTPRYSAVTTVQINDQSAQVLTEQTDSQANTNSAWDVDRFLNTQLEIIKSRGLAERVARKLNLIGNEHFFAAEESAAPPASASEAERREAVIGLLSANLDVDLPRDTRIVRIGYSGTDPALAAAIANAFASEFIQANLQRKFDSSAYARDFVAQQLEEARVRLEASERELNAYARNAGLIRTRDPNAGLDGGTAAGSVTTASLMELNSAANQAQAERIAAESRWRAEQATPLFSSKAVLANPTVQGLMGKKAELETARKAAAERYLDANPKVAAIDAELASVNQQLTQVANDVRNSIRADYLAAQSAEERLKAQVDRLQVATLGEQDRAVRYNTLAREADTNRSLYDGLLQRYRELNATAGISTSNLAIIDEADPPLGPSSPNLFKNLAIALLLGLVLASVVVFLRDQLDDRVRVPEDLEEKTHLPLLGVIPRSDEDGPLPALADPKSPIAEAYGSLRGSLLYSTREGLPKLMLVASAQPGEGKSTTCYAAALGFARMGRKVLLVDADLRRPSVHRLVTADNRRGLSTLLVSHDPVASAITPSGEVGLDLLTSGPLPPDPTGLLSSPRMAALLEEFGRDYDCVLIDSPPVLGLADAPTLAALVDGVVFVIEADRGRRGALKTALRRLRMVDAVILGAVMTKFDAAKAGNRYSGYYGYEYYRYAADGAT